MTKPKIPTFRWRQVDGDMNPSQHGGTIAEADGERIWLIKIQPVREYVGDAEALEVGFPFWSREACFDADDLNPERDEVKKALSCVGLDASELEEDGSPIAIACALLDYGHADEAEAGWARDVLGDRRVEWWGRSGKRPMGWRYLADEDVEFRRMRREAKRSA